MPPKTPGLTGVDSPDKPGFDLGTGLNIASPGLGAIAQGRLPTLQDLTDPLGLFSAPELGFEAQVPEMDLRDAIAARANQESLVKMLQEGAAGRGPSAAQALMAQGLGQAQQAAASQAASARGANAAMANRAASQQASAAQAAISNQASQLRAAEQQAAQRQLGGVLAGQRGQDIGIASTEATNFLTAQGQNLQGAMANQQAASAAKGGILGAAGGVLSSVLSDIRAKEDITPATDRGSTMSPVDIELIQQLSQLDGLPLLEATGGGNAADSRANLDAIQPSRFSLTPEAAEATGTDSNERLGVMAQDLLQSSAFRESVVPTELGLTLDKDRLLQANTAELGGLDKRLKALEGFR